MSEGSAEDLGPEFDGIRIGRPATSALWHAGYRGLHELPQDLESLLQLHGVGPKAVAILKAAQAA